MTRLLVGTLLVGSCLFLGTPLRSASAQGVYGGQGGGYAGDREDRDFDRDRYQDRGRFEDRRGYGPREDYGDRDYDARPHRRHRHHDDDDDQ